MLRNYHSEIHLHFTWHCKERAPMITTEVEELLFAALRKKAARLGGVYIKELGAIPTHLYAAISVEPTITPSELVGELKGYSHEVNRRMGIERRE